jgi:hypothetical protein
MQEDVGSGVVVTTSSEIDTKQRSYIMAEATHGELARPFGAVAGGSAVEAAGGLAVAILAILGLAGVFPGDLVAVATIGLGIALFSEGGAVAARYRRVLAHARSGHFDMADLGGGITAELLAGGAGTILGVLALLGVVSHVLIASAVIVFGAGLLFGSGAMARLNAFAATTVWDEQTAGVAREAVRAAAGAQVLIAISSIVLGVLSLVGMAPMILTLVALLALGTSVLLSGSAITGRMLHSLAG